MISSLVGLASLASSCSGQAETIAATTTVPTTVAETTATTEVPMALGKQLFVWTPEPGDCWDKRKPDITKPEDVVLKLACHLPHSYEIYAVIDVPTKEFPGDPLMKAIAAKECPRQFKAYVGAPYETSKWEIDYHFPTMGEWAKTTKHLIGCYLRDQRKGQKLEGSKKGSAQ